MIDPSVNTHAASASHVRIDAVDDATVPELSRAIVTALGTGTLGTPPTNLDGLVDLLKDFSNSPVTVIIDATAVRAIGVDVIVSVFLTARVRLRIV